MHGCAASDDNKPDNREEAVRSRLALESFSTPGLDEEAGDDHGVLGREVLPEGCLQLAQFHLTDQPLVHEAVAEILGEIEQEAAPVVSGREHMNHGVDRDIGEPGISK
jgi:hypothetical protein